MLKNNSRHVTWKRQLYYLYASKSTIIQVSRRMQNKTKSENKTKKHLKQISAT